MRYQNIRHKDGQTIQYPVRKVSLAEALKLLIQADLDFGGAITEFDYTHLVSTSTVMGDKDIATFSGSWDEMQVLFKLGQYLKKKTFSKYRIMTDGDGGILNSRSTDGSALNRRQTLIAMLFHAFGLTAYPVVALNATIADVIAALTIHEHPTAYSKDIYSLFDC